MKRCLFLIIWGSILFVFNARSQTPSIQDSIRNILSQIDLSETETNYFYDQVPDYLPLELFDGSYFTDSVFMHNGRFLLFISIST